MTELNSFQSAGSIPVWALPNAPDMTKWQWQPPNPPSFWPKAPEAEIEVDADNELGPVLSEPEPQAEPVVAPKPSATLGLRETVAAGEQIMLRTLAETTPQIGLELQTLFNNTFSTARDFTTRFRDFTKSLQKEISGGRLRGPQIFEVYDLGRRALVRAHRLWPQVTRPSLLPLLSSVIEGIKATEQLNPGFLRSNPQSWAVLLKHLARQDASVKSAKLFALLMESMPPMCRFKTRGAVLNVLSAYFRIWQDASIHGNSPEGVETEVVQALQLSAMWAGRADENMQNARSRLAGKDAKPARRRRSPKQWRCSRPASAQKNLRAAKRLLATAEKCHDKASRFISKAAHLLSDDRQLIGYLADALKTHHPRVHRSLFVIATRLQGGNQGKWTRVGYNWLQMLARLPNLPESRFRGMLQQFKKRGRGALSHTELGDLLLLHWESKGMLTDLRSTRRIWKRLRDEDDTTALASLAFAINAKHSPEQCTAMFWSFWNFMQLWVGKRAVIHQMLSFSKVQNLSSGFLKRLAWTSADNRTALMLHDILVKQTGKDTNAWGPAFWEKYVTQHMRRSEHSLINPAVLVEKLLSSTGPAEADCQEADEEAQDPDAIIERKHRQRMRIRESIKIAASAPSLTARQRFRHTAAFTKYLANVQGFLTARDLASLTDVTTEVLKRGEGGSTQRMRWYLGIILEQLGEEACVRVGMMLKRRREWNGQQLAGGANQPQEPEIIRHTSSNLHRQRYKGPHQGKTWPLWRYHLLKNRQRDELRRIGKKKAKARRRVRKSEAAAQPYLTSDAFGTICEDSYRSDYRPGPTF